MIDFDLNEIENIEFVDEYPKVREPLRVFEENVLESEDLIDKLITIYKTP